MNALSDQIVQHTKEINETSACWKRKPLLRSSYKRFHQNIAKLLVSGPGKTVELGSGIGVIKETIPDCITTDIFPSKWTDQVEDVYALSFPDSSVQNMILFDVWHHLENPGDALNEIHRVLDQDGRLILFEPAAMSLLGRFVYHFFHHEPIHSDTAEEWHSKEPSPPQNRPYYAAQGNAWKHFRNRETPAEFSERWEIEQVNYYSAFDWLAAGGFRQTQLLPSITRSPLLLISHLCDKIPYLFSTRMLVRIKKKAY